MNTKRIVKIHKTLSDQTRWEVFAAILQRPGLSGKELLAEFKISQPTLSFHLSKLEQSGIIDVKKEGQSHYYSPQIGVLEDVIKYAQNVVAMSKKSR